MRDYYAVLEVSAGATTVQIRRAYQRLARRYSPDVNFWERDAQALFEEIAEAYRILSDPTARSVYDRQGARPAGRSGPHPSEATRSARRGGDAHVAVELSFAQAIKGVEADVPVDRLSPCESCRATGAAPGVEPTTCSHCGGLGTVWSESSRDGETCPACDGAGVRVAVACSACRGRRHADRAVVRVLLRRDGTPAARSGSPVKATGAVRGVRAGNGRDGGLHENRLHAEVRQPILRMRSPLSRPSGAL